MAAVRLRPLQEGDLSFVSEVRHDPSTLRHLHDSRVYSPEEMLQWFADCRPEWYVIFHDETPVGYVRTSNRDDYARLIWCGVDIHPDSRRNGYATAAFQAFFETMESQGIREFCLEVLSTNAVAIPLYQKLGFQQTGCRRKAVYRDGEMVDSTEMCRRVEVSLPASTETPTGKNAKVTAFYFGTRRRPPMNARESFALLSLIIATEKGIDPGCEMDSVFVCNRAGEGGEWNRKCEELLRSDDGQRTRRGRIRVLFRENRGLSFGAFSHAFTSFADEYDYWQFTEDDHLMLRDGYFRRAVEQLRQNPTLGGVCTVRTGTIHREHPPFAKGGIGVFPGHVLKRAAALNVSPEHPHGRLAYYDREPTEADKRRHPDSYQYLHHGRGSEVIFSAQIHGLGYDFVDLDMAGVCLPWGRDHGDNARMLGWPAAYHHK